MTRSEIQKSLQDYVNGACCIGLKDICGWLGKTNQTLVKQKYLADLEHISGKKYFIPDVAQNIYERR